MKVLKAVLSVVALSAVVVAMVFLLLPSGPVENWEYDDYIECGPEDTATGSIEVLTLGDKTYFHAKGIGSAKVIRDGKEYDCNVSKAQLDLIFIYGQSNAAYRNPDPDAVSPKPFPGTGYYFGFQDRYAAVSKENSTGMKYQDADFWSMYDGSGNLRIGDKAPALTYEYNRMTGHKVYIVDGAIGGRSIVYFIPPASYVWEYGKAVLGRALDLVDESLFDLHYGSYVWIQGESDRSMSVEEYSENFLSIHTAMLEGEMGIPFETVYISLLAEKYENPRKAQLALSEAHLTIILAADLSRTFTEENGLLGDDGIHYTQKGNNLIGQALGICLAKGSGITVVKGPAESVSLILTDVRGRIYGPVPGY